MAASTPTPSTRSDAGRDGGAKSPRPTVVNVMTAKYAALPKVAAAPAAAGSSDPCRDPSGVWSGLIRVLFPFGADAARAIWMDSAAVSPSCGLVRD